MKHIGSLELPDTPSSPKPSSENKECPKCLRIYSKPHTKLLDSSVKLFCAYCSVDVAN